MLLQPSANALGGPKLLSLVLVLVPSPAPRDSPHELSFLMLLQLQRQSSALPRGCRHRAGHSCDGSSGTSNSGQELFTRSPFLLSLTFLGTILGCIYKLAASLDEILSQPPVARGITGVFFWFGTWTEL